MVLVQPGHCSRPRTEQCARPDFELKPIASFACQREQASLGGDQNLVRTCGQQAMRLSQHVVIDRVNSLPALFPAPDSTGSQRPGNAVRICSKGNHTCGTAFLYLPLAIVQCPDTIARSCQRARPFGWGVQGTDFGGARLRYPALCLQPRQAFARGGQYDPIARCDHSSNLICWQAVCGREEFAHQLEVASGRIRHGSRGIGFGAT